MFAEAERGRFFVRRRATAVEVNEVSECASASLHPSDGDSDDSDDSLNLGQMASILDWNPIYRANRADII